MKQRKHHQPRLLQRFARRFFRKVEKEAGPISPPSPTIIRKIPQKFKDVPVSLRDTAHLKSKQYRDRKTDMDWTYVHPDIKRFAQRFQKECEALGIPIWIFEVHRTPERQRHLKYVMRTSKADPWSSPHQYGLAVDLIHSVKLWDMTDLQWEYLNVLARELARKMNLKLTYGIDWGRTDTRLGWDKPHIQLKNWKDWRSSIRNDHIDPDLSKADRAKAPQYITKLKKYYFDNV